MDATALIPPSPFAAGLRCYHVDDYQQYLAKNPYGYRCHATTGIPFPSDS